ncbi:SH3 domain-containing protein [Bacillus massiliigorillae]|uniref:SH3 domain-containing protein n=1 Tax=Bacillus massiliigorillae TaxID=1243664 RepID=UPI0005A79A2F|nr:SH3 domain-containing protein [Bacillus massiliigorillae]
MRRQIVLSVISIVMFCSLWFWQPISSSADTYQFANVSADTLRVRSTPSTNASIVGVLQQNQQVQILGTQNGWSKIEFGSTIGWVSSEYLRFKHLKGYTTGSSLNIRSKASDTSTKIGSLNKGTQVTIISESQGWYYIQSGYINGWVSKDYISLQGSKEDSTPSRDSNYVGGIKYVKSSTLNVRSKSSTNSTIVQVLKQNDQVTVLQEVGEWSKVQFSNGQGWVANQYLASSTNTTQENSHSSNQGNIVLRSNANLRTGPSTQHQSVLLGQAGSTYKVIGSSGDWIQVQLPNGSAAWVASWLTTGTNSTTNTSNGTQQTTVSHSRGIQGKTIVLDAGHGGRDPGKIGATYLEKDLTLATVMETASLLQAAGANVIFTRNQDAYIALEERVRVSHASNADAFISFHYNSALKTSSGIMSFYYSPSKDRMLANSIQNELVKNTNLHNAGVHFGDFHVSRENSKPSVLVELGFLSNPTEESIISTASYRQKVARGIVQGVTNYFNQ